MNPNWSAVIEGVAAGVAASLILGIGALSRNRISDLFFRWRLKRAFRLMSCGHNLDGITIGVGNHLGRSFTVRDLVLITDKVALRLDPTDEVSSTFKGQYPKPSRSERRALKKGLIKEIPLGTEVQFRKWLSSPSREGFATVEPFTSHRFLLPYQLLGGKEVPSGFRMTIEYEAWPQKRKILQITTPGSLDQVRKMFAHAREQLANGALNAARAPWGKPPITSRSDPQDT